MNLATAMMMKAGGADATPLLLSQWEWINSQSWSDSEKKEILARRYATDVVSPSGSFIPSYFSIPASVTWANGESWVDDYMGHRFTIVKTGGARIKNCERWIINDNGIFFTALGSGSNSRNLFFYRRGQAYNVLGGGSNSMSITLNGANSTEASDRANNAWFLTDTIIAWVDGNDSVATRDIISGTTGSLSITWPGSEYLNCSQSDGMDCRRAYDNPITNPIKSAFNTANPSADIDDDKVYKIFHVNAAKTEYIILVYTISTGAWSYLDSTGATVTESSSVVVHTISIAGGATVDYLSLSVSGKRVISNTVGDGFNYHYVDGTKVLQVYQNSNHKSMGPIYDAKEWYTEKLTGSASDNTTFQGKAGDMYFLGVDPENETRHWRNSVVMPAGDTALYQGGDQGSHSGCSIAAYAGHRDNEPNTQQTWTKQIIVMDPEYSFYDSGWNKWGRFRVAKLNVTTGGGDSDDPGAIPDVMYESTDFPGRYVTGIYFHDVNVDHNGTLREGIFYAEVQVLPDLDDFATVEGALTSAGLQNNQ